MYFKNKKYDNLVSDLIFISKINLVKSAKASNSKIAWNIRTVKWKNNWFKTFKVVNKSNVDKSIKIWYSNKITWLISIIVHMEAYSIFLTNDKVANPQYLTKIQAANYSSHLHLIVNLDILRESCKGCSVWGILDRIHLKGARGVPHLLLDRALNLKYYLRPIE